MPIVKRLSKQGNMILMENSELPKGEEWFFLDEKVRGFAKNLKGGDAVEIKSEDRNGDSTITFIKKEGTAPAAEQKLTHTLSSSSKSTYGKSPEEQDSIKKQAMMKAAADAVATAMQGQVDVETLGAAIETLYVRLLNKLNS